MEPIQEEDEHMHSVVGGRRRIMKGGLEMGGGGEHAHRRAKALSTDMKMFAQEEARKLITVTIYEYLPCWLLLLPVFCILRLMNQILSLSLLSLSLSLSELGKERKRGRETSQSKQRCVKKHLKNISISCH